MECLPADARGPQVVGQVGGLLTRLGPARVGVGVITPHRSRLLMDIIEANECLRAWFGRPVKGSFDDSNIGREEGETVDDNHESGQSLEDEDNNEDESDHDEDQEGGPTAPINVS